MSFRTRLKATFTIRKRTRVSDGQGGHSYTTDDSLQVSGLLRQLEASESEIGGKIRSVENYRLYCEPADITRDDQVIDAAGRIYEVATPNDVHQLGRVMQVDLRIVG